MDLSTWFMFFLEFRVNARQGKQRIRNHGMPPRSACALAEPVVSASCSGESLEMHTMIPDSLLSLSVYCCGHLEVLKTVGLLFLEAFTEDFVGLGDHDEGSAVDFLGCAAYHVGLGFGTGAQKYFSVVSGVASPAF